MTILSEITSTSRKRKRRPTSSIIPKRERTAVPTSAIITVTPKREFKCNRDLVAAFVDILPEVRRNVFADYVGILAGPKPTEMGVYIATLRGCLHLRNAHVGLTTEESDLGNVAFDKIERARDPEAVAYREHLKMKFINHKEREMKHKAVEMKPKEEEVKPKEEEMKQQVDEMKPKKEEMSTQLIVPTDEDIIKAEKVLATDCCKWLAADYYRWMMTDWYRRMMIYQLSLGSKSV